LWLVARECLADEKSRAEFRAAGEKLASRAVAAAKRQEDKLYGGSILREWGQLDLDAGDKTRAQARWTEMLEFMLPRTRTTKAVGAAPAGVSPAAAPVPAAPALPLRKMPQSRGAGLNGLSFVSAQQPPAAVLAAPATGAASAGRGSSPALTTDQFQDAYAIARLAAEKGLPQLSLKAIKDAIRGGPLVPGKAANYRGGGRLMSRSIGGKTYYVEEMGVVQFSVDQALADLVPKWRAMKVPPADIYDVVAAVVLPDERPAEVFLQSGGRVSGMVYILNPGGYLTPATGVNDEGQPDQGLAGLLCEAAIEAGKVENLRAKARTRTGQPLGELPAQVLLATLAIHAKDDAGAIEVFRALGARIQKDSLYATNDQVANVLVPALANPKFAEVIVPFIEKAADNFLASNNTQRAVELRFKLAERHLDRKEVEAARAQFKIVENMGKKVGQNNYDVHTPLAGEYLKAGWVEDALRELGLQADAITAASATPSARARRSEPTLADFPRLVRLLLDLPAAKRYEALKAWSLPTAGRKSIRYFVGTMPKDAPPAVFGPLPKLPLDEVVSTMLLLVDAAREAGKTDELAAIAEKLASEKIENADLFLVLVKLALGKGKEAQAQVKAFSEEARKRLTDKPEEGVGPRYYDNDNRGPVPLHPSEILFARMCLLDPALVSHGESLLKPMLDAAQSNQSPDSIRRITASWNRLGASRAGAPDALENGLPARWQPV
ncbi:MAG TPA: hypothetical protein VLM40_22540, partial [Gemmata sp.]|nr:hypothetical protein [Gemmata sp.]